MNGNECSLYGRVRVFVTEFIVTEGSYVGGELMMIEWKEKRRIPNMTSRCVWELIMSEGVK